MKWSFIKILTLGCVSLIAFNVMASGKITGYRGQVFYFVDDPVFSHNSYKYYKNGILYVQDGKVLEAGDYSALKSNYTARGHKMRFYHFSYEQKLC